MSNDSIVIPAQADSHSRTPGRETKEAYQYVSISLALAVDKDRHPSQLPTFQTQRAERPSSSSYLAGLQESGERHARRRSSGGWTSQSHSNGSQGSLDKSSPPLRAENRDRKGPESV
ncbi:predicted protein [Histoplasma capsulatum var. duboisii H88]|uniref:Predicted protein n=1 Tax=Ajellomyces capsulatus (strain H88) TaxID=544711 RepID=F0UD02_AJEC8|nr:predicted protein [Histoplasma capsulatum var. duboisii H88]